MPAICMKLPHTPLLHTQEASSYAELKRGHASGAAATSDFASIVASVAATRAAEANLQMNCGACETCLNTQVCVDGGVEPTKWICGGDWGCVTASQGVVVREAEHARTYAQLLCM